MPPVQAAPLAFRLSLLLPSYGLGAAAAALLVQRGGSTYHCAGDLGADIVGGRQTGLAHDDPRNPAIVAGLVGGHLGLAAPRAVDLLLSATVANVAAAITGAAVYRANAEELPGVLPLVCLPIAVRAFGVIASGFGVMVVRGDESQAPAAALWRGQATTATLALGGLVGACIWLLGERYTGWLVAAGAAGIAASTAAAHAARYRAARRFGPLRDLLDALRSSGGSAVTQGLGVGLEAALLPVLAVGAAMIAAWHLGAATGLRGGELLASLTALMAMLASGPYLLAVGIFAPIADSARRVAAMSAAAPHAEAQRRTARLSDAGLAATTVAQTYLIVVGCLTALLAAAALPLLTGEADAPASLLAVDVSKPVVMWSGALGAAAVLAYAGSAARAATRSARGVAAEVERQLRGFPREGGVCQLPRDYTPSYRVCIDLAARTALHRLLPTVSAALLLPAALAVALSMVYGPSYPGLAREALTSFVVIAAVTGLGAALAVDATRGALCLARRGNRTNSAQYSFDASATAETVAGVMGNSAGPAAQLLVKATAVTSLAVAPFLM